MNRPASQPAILLCSCQRAQVVPADVKQAVMARLQKAGVAFETVPDLCELAARRDERLAQWAARPMKIAACFPRAVKWLFAAGGAPLQPQSELLNLRAQSADDVVAALLPGEISSHLPLGNVNLEAAGCSDACAVTPPEGWPAWFPVIDYDRCTQCMQCLSFCLFGVYGVDAAHGIQVQHPDLCKPNCPACSRVCPQAAIMFPKHKTGPINGDAVTEADMARESMKVDISALLGGGDAHAMLRARSERAKTRFSKEKDGDQALSERRKCLAKLGSAAADIPAEILMSLPPPEVIARKVEEAAARARAALQARTHT